MSCDALKCAHDGAQKVGDGRRTMFRVAGDGWMTAVKKPHGQPRSLRFVLLCFWGRPQEEIGKKTKKSNTESNRCLLRGRFGGDFAYFPLGKLQL